MEVNAIGSYPPTAQFMNEQEVELLQRLRHARQNGAFFPSLLGRGLPSELRRR